MSVEQIELLQRLQNSSVYDHRTDKFSIMETHISWVILTGIFAYKIKKSVNLEFVDYTTLEKRKHFCEEEFRLNKEFVPELYLEVVSITENQDKIEINGEGDIIEYAVKMKEFSQEFLFDALLSKNKLKPKYIVSLAERLARLHQKKPIVGDDKHFGTAEQVHKPVVQNFDQIRPFLKEEKDIEQLDKLAAWAEQEHSKLFELFKSRKADGFIRECHGDTHLRNILLLHNVAMIFDCIEFNDSFLCTDVMADLGFLAMDFEEKDRPDFANILISAYCMETGDYTGLQVLDYYKAYRAVVRAKVNIFGLLADNLNDEQKATILSEYRRRTDLAESYIDHAQPSLYITHGYAASGKSTLSAKLVEAKNIIYLRSDIERKRIHELSPTAHTHSEVNAGLYTFDITDKTYNHLEKLTETILLAGHSIIVDASFLHKNYRDNFKNLSDKLHVPFHIIDFDAPVETLKQRIIDRQKDRKEPSEAYIEVLEMQIETSEPLTESELSNTITADSMDIQLD